MGGVKRASSAPSLDAIFERGRRSWEAGAAGREGRGVAQLRSDGAAMGVKLEIFRVRLNFLAGPLRVGSNCVCRRKEKETHSCSQPFPSSIMPGHSKLYPLDASTVHAAGGGLVCRGWGFRADSILLPWWWQNEFISHIRIPFFFYGSEGSCKASQGQLLSSPGPA